MLNLNCNSIAYERLGRDLGSQTRILPIDNDRSLTYRASSSLRTERTAPQAVSHARRGVGRRVRLAPLRSGDGQLVSACEHQEGAAEQCHDGGPGEAERGKLADLPVVPEIEQGHSHDLGVRPD